MKHLPSIIAFTVIILFSCEYAATKNVKQPLLNIDSVRTPFVAKDIVTKSDSCTLRFLSDYSVDTIKIKSYKNYKQQIIVTTNKSTGYAYSCKVLKNKGGDVEINIKGSVFSFPLKSDYLFVDIYYEKANNSLTIYYSNNILILS